MRLRWAIPVVAGAGLLLGTSAVWSGGGQQKDLDKAKDIFNKLLQQSKTKDLANPSIVRKENEDAGWETKVIMDDKGKPHNVKIYVGKGTPKTGVARVEPVDPMGLPVPPPPPPMPGAPPPPPSGVQTMVKVWAELSDEQGTHSGKLVNIELYKWHPVEYFYFWFDAPIPVQMSIQQYYNVGPQEAKDPKLVSPSPAFPNTYATVVPGAPTSFPQLFRTDKTQRDEFVTLTVLQAGVPIPVPPSPGQAPVPTVPPLNTPTAPPPAGTPPAPVANNVFTQNNNMLNLLAPATVLVRKEGDKVKLSYTKDKEPYRLEPINPPTPPPPTPNIPPSAATFTDPNMVAMYALGTQNMGMLPLRFSK